MSRPTSRCCRGNRPTTSCSSASATRGRARSSRSPTWALRRPPEPVGVAPGADPRTDLPRYRIYKDGVLADEVTDVRPFWRDDLVAFLLGCSFTFEWALLDAGIPMRHIE